jgi:sulfur-oxidizing protein SoxX
MTQKQQKNKSKQNVLFLLSTVLTLILLTVMLSIEAAAETADSKTEEGKKLTLDFCQACHQYEGTEQAGTVAPPLVAIKARFPDRKKLYDIIYDPHKAINSQTMMPPFGRNNLMTKEEIDKVIDFLYTL